jgi:thiamine biosynthesis lipoprotein
MDKGRMERVLIERSRRLMATRIDVHLSALPGDEAHAEEAVERCMAWLADVAQRLTRFERTSELSALNAAAGRWRHVSETLFAAVEESVAAARASDGLFDPGLLALLEALGYDRDYAEIAGREAGLEWRVDADATRSGGWRDIELDPARRAIRLPAGVRLDLGGIVKGWAADIAMERFFGAFPGVIVNAGGDLRVRGGPAEGALWPLGVADPRADASAVDSPPEPRVVLTLGQGGMASSGATDRWWFRAGERQHHLLDPRTGRPARAWIDTADDAWGDQALIATATALAPTAAHAEVAAKVAMLRGYPGALTAVERAWDAREADAARNGEPIGAYGDDGVGLILMLGTGKVACSANMQAYLDTLGGGGNLWLD